MSNLFTHILLTLLICQALAEPAPEVPNSKAIYIDPTTTDSVQIGEIIHPFQNLTQAFQSADSYITARSQNQTFEIIFYTKAGTQLTLAHESAVFKEYNQSFPSSIRFETYQDHVDTSPTTTRPMISIKDPSAYLSFSIPNLKLVIENYDFEFNLEDTLPGSELILFEGNGSEVTFTGCSFRNSKVNLKNDSTPLIRFQGGKYLIKESDFTDLTLANPLIELEDTLDSFVKFEMNKFSNIVTQGAALLKSTKAKSFDFMRNDVKKLTGNLVDVTSSNNVIFSENILSDVVGEFPLKFSSSQKLIFENNTINFESPEAKSHKGLLSFNNFDLLSLSHFNLSGYSGTASAVSAVLDDFYKGTRAPIVMIENLGLKDNALFGIQDNAISLINLQFKQKARIMFEDCEFSGNTLDYTENGVLGNIGASTMWIEAGNSDVEIKKSILQENKAVRGFSNLYINASKLQVENCLFIANTVLQPSVPSNGPENDLLFSAFEWFGDHISFTDNTFKENYGDFGGAIGIFEFANARVPQDVLIENCDFTKNKAKIGGAIYTNVTSNVLKSIKLAGNYFIDNKADSFPDYNTSPKFSVDEAIRLFLELSNSKKKTRYSSGDLIIKDIISKQKIGYQLEFYLSDRKNNRNDIEGGYYASISLINTENTQEGPAYLVKNFTDLPTNSSFVLEQFAIVAPPDSEYSVLFTMKNKANPQELHKFEFKIRTSAKAISCGKGEFFVPDGKFCKKCPAGTYSLQANTLECLPCPYGVDCGKGGADLKALPGFWHDNAQTDGFMVYPCFNKENCANDGLGQCARAYAGPLCEACDSNESGKGFYRPFQLNTCAPCQKLSLWDIGAFVIPVIFLLITVYMIVSPNTKEDSIFSWCLYTNLLVSYMQNIFILTDLEFINPPKEFMFFVNLIANPTLPVFGYATCFMQNLITSDYANIGFFSIFAAIISAKIVLILLLTKIVIKEGKFFRKALLAVIWLLYLENPGFMTLSLDILHCKQAGNTRYSGLFSGLECDSSGHQNLSNYFLYKYVLLLTIIIPFIANYSIIRGKIRDNESEEQKKLQVMIMANSTNHITKSNRSWLFFYYISFGKVALLFLQLSKTVNFFNLLIVAFYYSLLTVLNRFRVVTKFKSSRSRILVLDAIVPLLCVVIGYAIDVLEEGFIPMILEGILWIDNGVYIIFLLTHTTSSNESGEYGELEEDGDSRHSTDEKRKSSGSSEDKKDEHSRQSIENLDQTH